MDSPEQRQGAGAPEGGSSPASSEPSAQVSYAPTTDATGQDNDGYPYEDSAADASSSTVASEAPAVPAAPAGTAPPPPPPPSGPEEGDEEGGMLRMSFLEHLEELRSRIIKALVGVGVAFVVSLTFTNELWKFVAAPAVGALRTLGINPPNLTQITPMEAFNVIWVKLPILCSIFLASPWILYQVWAFIAPGLYRRERRWAAPFVLGSAGLFITGGVFAYFVAFRYGLTFLLSIGRGIYVTPMVSISEYFDLFVNVILGVGLVFEMPVLIFFLSLLRIVSPKFLLRNSRYAILIIVIIAAIVTPTPDVFNLMLFATPMCLLFYVGIFASYLLQLHREERRFPWRKVFGVIAVATLLLAGALYLGIAKFGYHFVPHWPFFMR